MKYAAVGPIALHFPEHFETNAHLQANNPRWDMDLIASKTGINQRHIAAPDECSSDLGVASAEKLFEEFDICLLYTSPSPRDGLLSRMPSSA